MLRQYVDDLFSSNGNPQVVDTLTFASLQASFDSNVLGGVMDERTWYSMTISRYPEYTDMANVIIDEYRRGTRGQFTSGGMTRPTETPSPTFTSSATSSVLGSSDAAFIAAALAGLGIALLILRGR